MTITRYHHLSKNCELLALLSPSVRECRKFLYSTWLTSAEIRQNFSATVVDRQKIGVSDSNFFPKGSGCFFVLREREGIKEKRTQHLPTWDLCQESELWKKSKVLLACFVAKVQEGLAKKRVKIRFKESHTWNAMLDKKKRNLQILARGKEHKQMLHEQSKLCVASRKECHCGMFTRMSVLKRRSKFSRKVKIRVHYRDEFGRGGLCAIEKWRCVNGTR